MPRSYDEIISLEVGRGYRNLGDPWVNHKRKKKSGGQYLLLPLIILLEFGVCQGRASAFFFFQAKQTVRKRLPRKRSSYEVRGCGLAPGFKVRTEGTLLNGKWQPRWEGCLGENG